MADAPRDEPSSISGETLEKAKKELFEVPEKRAEAVAELRAKIDALEGSPEFEGVIFSRKDGKFLLRFLRAKKFDMERALKLYCNYYKYRHKYSHMFHDFHPQAVEHVLRSGVFGLTQIRRKDGALVVQLRPSRWDTNTVPFVDNYRTLLLILEKLIEDEENQVHGLAIVNNLDEVPFLTIFKLAQTEQMQKGMFVELLQECFPFRFKGLHLVNQPWYISLVLTIVRPFMKQKLKDRIFLHGSDYTTLHQHFDPEQLPECLGGSGEDFDPLCGLKFFEEELSEKASTAYPQEELQSVE